MFCPSGMWKIHITLLITPSTSHRTFEFFFNKMELFPYHLKVATDEYAFIKCLCYQISLSLFL